MILRHVIRPHAQEDLDNQVDFYEEHAGLEIALRFLDGVKQAIEFLYQQPRAGSPREFSNPRLKGLRSWPVDDFDVIRI